MVAQSSAHKKEDSNVFKEAWHSVAEALHLREETPPPVPPKDEKWLVKTVNKAVPAEQKPDPSFWDRLFHSQEKKKTDDDDDDNDGVSISVPADAALQQLGVEGDDKHLEEKKNYFKRMAQRVKEKFDDDDNDDSDDSDNNDSDVEEEAKKTGKTVDQLKEEKKKRRKLAPKVDPKEMQQAHKVLYKNKNADDSDSDEEDDKKLFGHWWGCRPRRSKADKLAAKDGGLLDGEEWEKVKAPRSKNDKLEADLEENGDGRSWWQFGMGKTREEREKDRARNERKATTKRRQALAAAAAYEAVKEYEARRSKKTGKQSSHSEMKAVLAGMAMAEAVKLLEKYNDDDEMDADDKDDTVAEAGNKALKLFELCR